MKTALVLTFLLSATLAGAAIPPFGTWEWLETEQSAGVIITPADVGYTVQFAFNNDMTYIEYRDQLPYVEGIFWVTDVEYMGVIITALTFDFGDVSPETCAYGFDGEGRLHMWWGADSGGWPSYPVERYLPRGPVGDENASWGSIKSLYR
jgi:hypothetical protein